MADDEGYESGNDNDIEFKHPHQTRELSNRDVVASHYTKIIPGQTRSVAVQYTGVGNGLTISFERDVKHILELLSKDGQRHDHVIKSIEIADVRLASKGTFRVDLRLKNGDKITRLIDTPSMRMNNPSDRSSEMCDMLVGDSGIFPLTMNIYDLLTDDQLMFVPVDEATLME